MSSSNNRHSTSPVSGSTLTEIDGKFVFSDTLDMATSPARAFELLWQAERWPELLPHVESVRLLAEKPNFQQFEMATRGPTGLHVTESVRESTPSQEIRYHQVRPPAMLTEHSGRWLLAETEQGVRITSEHTIEIRPDAIEDALGRPYSLSEAALLSRHMIGNHSVATLKVVKRTAEGDGRDGISDKQASS